MKKLIYLLGLITIFSCQQKLKSNQFDLESEKATIEVTIKNTIGWVKNKDTCLLYSIIAKDENYLEVHPENAVIKGITQFKQAESFWLDERFTHVGFEIWDMHINISQDGTVAWFYCMLNDLNEWNGQSASWENTRWTGVLEKRKDAWCMVQMHFSYAAE